MGSLFGGGQAEQSAALENATKSYEQYRPDAYQAQMNALNSAMSAYQGANNALQTLWGAKARPGQPLVAKPATPMGMMMSRPVGPTAPPPQQPEQGGDFIQKLFDPIGLFS